MSNIIENKFGKTWPSGLVFVSYFIVFVSIFVIFAKPFLGIGLLIVCSFFAFTYSGIELDVENKKYRDYTKFFGLIKQGQWQSLEEFPYLTIMRKNMVSTIQSPGNVASISKTDTIYDIILLNESHRKKLVIKRHKSREAAVADAPVLAERLGVKQTDYNPQISEASRAKRR